VHLPSSAGIREGKRAHMDGIEIGEVMAVASSQPERPGVWVRLRVRPGVLIPNQARFVAQESTIGGEPFMDFLTQANPTGYLPTDGTARLEGILQPPSLLPPDLVAKFDGIASDFHQGIAQLQGLHDLVVNLKELSEPRTLADVKAGKRKNLWTALDQFETTAKTLQDEIQDPKSEFNLLLADARAGASSLSKTLKEVDATLSTVRTTADTYTKAGQALEQTSAEANKAIAVFTKDAEDAGALLKNINDLVENIQQGKGSLGQLANSDALHRQLVNLIEDLRAMTDNANRLMTLWREEGVFAKEGK
jgi:ABC-type transporter Mla subunit MlaD